MYTYVSKKRNGIGKTLITIILTSFVTVVFIKFIPEMIDMENNQGNTQRLSYTQNNNNDDTINNAEETNNNENSSIPDIVETVMESVVGVSVLKPDGNSLFDLNVTEKWGLGTGVIISNKGYILTNQHIATKLSSKISVTLADGTVVQGIVVWIEPNIDLAIIKIDFNNIKPAPIGNSEEIRVGEKTIAIGNPLGLEFQRTVTGGLVSGLNRTLLIEEDGKMIFMEDLIQTDASINPGNSGGPLLNDSGEVIGINTVKVTSAEGIGFAIPINIIKPILKKLEETGEFREAYLGIFAHDKEVIPYMTSKVNLDRGIYVVSVDNLGPSGKSGLKVGDIITKIDGIEINKMVELRMYLYEKSPGNEVLLTVVSGNNEKTVSIKLGEKR